MKLVISSLPSIRVDIWLATSTLASFVSVREYDKFYITVRSVTYVLIHNPWLSNSATVFRGSLRFQSNLCQTLRTLSYAVDVRSLPLLV